MSELRAAAQSKPTVPGFYWRRYSTGERWEVCEVMPGTMHAFFAGSPRGYALSEIEGEWVGPLQPPTALGIPLTPTPLPEET
jgi:hypothetical protein